ncbi:MAG: N-acetyltransferase [Leptolyngbyaceae cyanobacterium bins.59]|nr:N-acetyltransferase [Leptolyngbyaceae cyanobacterium bins.59]
MMKFQIRPEQAEDQPTIATLHQQAFGRENEAQLVERIRHSDRYVPELSLVAEKEGAIVGHGLFSYVDLVGPSRSWVLALAPIAVHPDYQRQGIGSALIEAGIELAETSGEPLINVLGHPEFYARLGFEPALQYRIACSLSVPDEAFLVRPLLRYSEDYKGIVVYPPAFEGV